MRGHVDVLSQYTVNLATETSILDGCSNITVDVIDSKVRADTVADFPTFYIFANCHNLASGVGAGNDVFLLTEKEWSRERWKECSV